MVLVLHIFEPMFSVVLASLFLFSPVHAATSHLEGLRVGPTVEDESLPKLRPFTSDGCSMSPNGFSKDINQSWLSCCIEHDKKYWAGGTRQEREVADLELKKCI